MSIDLAAALGEPLSETLTAQLFQYLDLLAHWNKAYNLTAVRSREGMLSQHLADCLAVVTPLRAKLSNAEGAEPNRLLDVGSGGGLPGVVLAACLPHLSVTCVDSVAKKAAFVRQVAAELGLPNLHSVHARVETLHAPDITPHFTHITSRAFSSLADFTRLTRHLLAPDGWWMAMKGKTPEDEIAALPNETAVAQIEPLSIPGLDADRCLVWMQPRLPT